MRAREIVEKLREQGVYVRYFNKPRIDDHLRITIGTDEEMDRLCQLLNNIL
jgi:histidinol-phosphate aminotransferase